jgi:hypothetical protein
LTDLDKVPVRVADIGADFIAAVDGISHELGTARTPLAVAHHRGQGHNPLPAPTDENPEQWLCKCDPDATWTAVWRILTPEQVRQKFAQLRKLPTF